MKALLNGLWVIDTNWITESLQTGELQPEVNYEVKGDTKGVTADCVNGPFRARKSLCRVKSGSSLSQPPSHIPGLSGVNRESKLFSDYEFYLMDDFVVPPKRILESLIKLGGGKVLSRKRVAESQPEALRSQQSKYIIISGGNTPRSDEREVTDVVHYSWVLDSISRYGICLTEEYSSDL